MSTEARESAGRRIDSSAGPIGRGRIPFVPASPAEPDEPHGVLPAFRPVGVGPGRSRQSMSTRAFHAASAPGGRGHLIVLLPALNEEPAIGHVIDRIPVARLGARGYRVSVWVVDGQSTDRTMDIARARGARTFVQDGTGKGNGMRQALRQLLATSRGDSDLRLFVMLDADGSYRAEEIPRFVDALESGEDVVLGSRLEGAIEDGAISDLNRIGNRLLSRLASILFGVRVSDVCTGMWAFREDAIRRFGLVAKGFDLEADLFASACQRRLRLRELPIAYDRRIGEPKLIPIRTGFAIAWRLLMRRLNESPVGSGGRPRRSSPSREEAA